jgi:3-oxoacyl-[acyl-carrier protein] reductase
MPVERRTLITGSTRNIGLAIAERLAADGFVPILNYARDENRAERALAAIRALRPEAKAIRADVTRESDVTRMIEEAVADGPIDLLVNNVGAFLWRPLLETSLDDWDRMIAANLTATFLCCRAMLPRMRERGRGAIINVASMHAERSHATPNTLPYAIAKAGVARLTKTLAKTEGRHGIRVNAISPGYVDTGANLPPDAASKVPLGRIAAPEEIAAAVSFLASDEASHVTGTILDVHGGALL